MKGRLSGRGGEKRERGIAAKLKMERKNSSPYIAESGLKQRNPPLHCG